MFLSAVLLALIGLSGLSAPPILPLLSIVVITAAIPLVNRFIKQTEICSWFLCIFLVLGSSFIAASNSGISSPASVLLLVPIFWSLLLLRSKGSTTIAILVIANFVFITYMGILREGNGFAIEQNAANYLHAFVLILAAITFALVGWLISEAAAAARSSLLAMRDEARKANREKSEFIASIAHEIRTPLTGLMGMLELLSREHLEHTQKDMAQTARTSSRDILNLINDLLDMSKMEIGELRLVPEPVNVVELFAQTTREFNTVAADKKLKFTTVTPEENIWLLLDPLRFRQVLSNYLSNALKFTDEGYIEARLICQETSDNDVRLQIEISDTGPGIPSHLVTRVFGRFVQVEQTQKARYGGTGIGLSIVADLARLQGGKVWVDSVHGSGSTFYFNCDFKRTSAMELPSTSDTRDSKRSPLSVLIADDSVGTQRVLTRILRGLGYSTVSVENGADAILAVTSHDIDVVLLDLNMPFKDGPAALKAIRQLPSPVCNIPVVGMSADNSETEMSRWDDTELNGFVEKPVDFAALDLTIQRATELAGSKQTKLTVNTGDPTSDQNAPNA